MTDRSIVDRRWKIAAALAHASGLDWGAWARRGVPAPDCDACNGRGGRPDAYVPDQWYPCDCLAWPDPSDVEAYTADCARRGVSPGPLPSLEYRSDDVWWKVGDALTGAMIVVRDVDVYVGENGYADIHAVCVTVADLIRATELARVTVDAMR